MKTYVFRAIQIPTVRFQIHMRKTFVEVPWLFEQFALPDRIPYGRIHVSVRGLLAKNMRFPLLVSKKKVGNINTSLFFCASGKSHLARTDNFYPFPLQPT